MKITAIIGLIFGLATAIGWIANIIQIMSSIPATFGEMAPIFAVKCVGVFFFPIGAILGWVGFF